MELGDAVEAALSKVGITKGRVSSWLGKDCGCEKRQQKLNQLSLWARRVLTNKPVGNYLEEILEEHNNEADRTE